MKATTTNLLSLVVAGLVSLGVAWSGMSADLVSPVDTIALWAGGIGLVATLLVAAFLRDDRGSSPHVIRVEPGADMAAELAMYARHNGYGQWKINGEGGLIRRTPQEKPEIVVFEFVKRSKSAQASSFGKPLEKVPTQSNNGFTY